MQKLKDEICDLSAQLANVQFTYRDPVKNFDRSKVKGVVAKLIKVKNSSTMTALEVCNAYHIIVFKIRDPYGDSLTLSSLAGYCWWKII